MQAQDLSVKHKAQVRQAMKRWGNIWSKEMFNVSPHNNNNTERIRK